MDRGTLIDPEWNAPYRANFMRTFSPVTVISHYASGGNTIVTVGADNQQRPVMFVMLRVVPMSAFINPLLSHAFATSELHLAFDTQQAAAIIAQMQYAAVRLDAQDDMNEMAAELLEALLLERDARVTQNESGDGPQWEKMVCAICHAETHIRVDSLTSGEREVEIQRKLAAHYESSPRCRQ